MCLSIVEEDGGVEVVEEVYDPPASTKPRATITLCRRDMHVVSTSPSKSLPDPSLVFAPPSLREVVHADEEGASALDEGAGKTEQDVELSMKHNLAAPCSPKKAEIKLDLDDKHMKIEFQDDTRLKRELDDDDKQHLDYHSVLEADEQSSMCDDEVSSFSPPVANLYDTEVTTKRLFVTVVLKHKTTELVGKLLDELRRSFPLEPKVLDQAVRWIEPNVMHITLHTLEVAEPRVEETQDLICGTVAGLDMAAFKVPTGDVGCLWRAAGTPPRLCFSLSCLAVLCLAVICLASLCLCIL